MAAVSKFRTSLGGFNREDVANYIEMTANEHLRQVRALEEDMAHLNAEKAALAAELEQVRTQLAAAQEGAAAPYEPQPEPDYASEELEAYRRAEAAERNAVARADKLHQQLTELCDSVTGSYAGCGEELQALCEALVQNYDGLKQKLEDIQNVFDAAKAKVEKLGSETEA